MNGVQYDSLVMNELRINIKTAGLGILRKAINHTKMKKKMWNSTDPVGILIVKV